MRRLVLICMMLLLPVQWTWAAAAAYCAHEASPGAAKHVGHHEHVHKASSAELSKKAPVTKASVPDLDCDYCQLSTTQWLPAMHSVVQAAQDASPPAEDPLLVGSHIGSGPERPDRALAV